MNADGLIATAIYFGYKRNHFYVIKNSSPKRFKYIEAINPKSFKDSYIKYILEMEEAKHELQDIYYYLSDNKLITKFSKYAYKYNIFSHKLSLSSGISKTIFTSKPGFSFHETYIRYKKLIPLFYQFKKDISYK